MTISVIEAFIETLDAQQVSSQKKGKLAGILTKIFAEDCSAETKQLLQDQITLEVFDLDPDKTEKLLNSFKSFVNPIAE